jgi:hypothetical protein
MFADDTACLVSNSNLTTITNFMNEEIEKIVRWFRANKMAVNLGKTKIHYLSYQREKISDSINLTNNDKELDQTYPT